MTREQTESVNIIKTSDVPPSGMCQAGQTPQPIALMTNQTPPNRALFKSEDGAGNTEIEAFLRQPSCPIARNMEVTAFIRKTLGCMWGDSFYFTGPPEHAPDPIRYTQWGPTISVVMSTNCLSLRVGDSSLGIDGGYELNVPYGHNNSTYTLSLGTLRNASSVSYSSPHPSGTCDLRVCPAGINNYPYLQFHYVGAPIQETMDVTFEINSGLSIPITSNFTYDNYIRYAKIKRIDGDKWFFEALVGGMGWVNLGPYTNSINLTNKVFGFRAVSLGLIWPGMFPATRVRIGQAFFEDGGCPLGSP